MNGRMIILGVTGSIAACKAVDLASLLVKAGAEVHVVMTPDAQRFVTPLPFKTLSPPSCRHRSLRRRRRLETCAHRIGRPRRPPPHRPGHRQFPRQTCPRPGHDALSCIALALNPAARLVLAPAMNGKMWLHPAPKTTPASSRNAAPKSSAPTKACSPAATKASDASGPSRTSPNLSPRA